MKAQCPICADLFVNDSEIAATKCGHTFHNHCLLKWMGQSRTCPSCRVRMKHNDIIHKLYFDYEVDTEEGEEDSGKLKNELATVRAQLLQKDKEKAEIVKKEDELLSKIFILKNAEEEKEIELKQIKNANNSLKDELRRHQSQQKRADMAMQESKRLAKKLENLETVEKIIKGVEPDIESNLSNYHESDTKQLCTWLAVLQKEMKTKKDVVKTLRNDNDKLKRELEAKKKLLVEKSESLVNVREQLKHSEQDLSSTEQQNRSLRKKIDALQQAIGSPTQTAASFTHRLIAESPAPLKRPRLSGPDDYDISDLNTSIDLFPNLEQKTNSVKVDTPTTQMKKDCKEYGTKFIKIKSATSQPKKNKPGSELSDVSNVALSNFNLFKKKNGSGFGQATTIRKGYNGFGGHEKFIQPSGVPLPKVQKTVRTFSTKTKPPRLPSMDKFLAFD